MLYERTLGQWLEHWAETTPDKMCIRDRNKVGAKAYLVNTGWNGSGKRISIKDTRGIIDAIPVSYTHLEAQANPKECPSPAAT